MEQMQTQELISALADGQLQGEAFARGVQLAASDRAAREAWETYHLIGDVLRSGERAVGSPPSVFLDRLQRRLQHEGAVAPAAAPEVAVQPRRAEAANDTTFRWKLVAGLASVAAVGAVAFSLVGGLAPKADGPQLARGAGGTVLTAGERGAMIRNPQLDELLAAHRQLGGSALQMSTGFVRNAAFESSDR
ncbi:sigma-E factor negative regulatory protein [Ramlibacter sp.]|uniref:sigma-E factor negative regulatory protein n=1 Tax=Ramlibacter sp. TaxID=1917967 RepID=UPI002BA9AF95|nr:sigma-E factor negative regulatory protein [Ramlibacter sp.]HWI80693.1 sigma-E factor negative regulatory protein [Ramlibacter sp.]